jgi:two-component system chemotaxis response regulator CheB
MPLHAFLTMPSSRGRKRNVDNRDILAIGTSAGGVEALRFLASELPHDLPASVLIVIHLPGHPRSTLDAILTQAGRLPASFAVDGETAKRGRIYIAPPERHLLLEGDKLRLGTGPRENNARPAIDPLFRSVALCCGPRGIGTVLTGSLHDGSSGLYALQQSGAVTVVQDPDDALFPDMPTAAIERLKPDHVIGLNGMPALLNRLVRQPAGKRVPIPETLAHEVEIAKTGRSSMSAMDRIGHRSTLACPDCGGVMWEIGEDELLRYRCHVGHAYSADMMSLALDEGLRRALAMALRALDERAALAKRMHSEAKAQGHLHTADHWERRLREAEDEANVIRSSVRRADEIAARAA